MSTNENNRPQKYPLYGGGTGFNQVLIQVQKIRRRRRKQIYPTHFLPRSALRASHVTSRSCGAATHVRQSELLSDRGNL